MFDLEDATVAGLGYAFFAETGDYQTDRIVEAIQQQRAPAPPSRVDVHVHLDDEEDERGVAPINALDWSTLEIPKSWDDYVGQEGLKRELQVRIAAARARGERLPHYLLATPHAGYGKTTAARLVAQDFGVDMIELNPPFTVNTVVKAAQMLKPHDVLFIDEVHRLTLKPRGSEILLKILEDGVAYVDGEAVPLPDITIGAATTDKDLLPETVLDRFKCKPTFRPYTMGDLGEIAARFTLRHDAVRWIDGDLGAVMARACRGVPRLVEEMVMAASDLGMAFNQAPTGAELLALMQIEWDGLAREHIDYLTGLRKYFRRETKEGGFEFVGGEASMMTLLRETKQAIARIERYLIECGFLDKTPRGRRLTRAGIRRAEQLIAQRKGIGDV